jgi:mannosylglucosylglycerate synthase
MNIALSHFRIGETDGVSLEMEKWKLILEKMGHKVYYLAGSPGNTEAYIIPELHYKDEENLKFIENAFVKLEDYRDEDDLKTAIEAYTERAEKHLEKFIKEYEIDVLVPNNIWSRGWNIPVAIAFTNVIKKLNVKCVAHNHDFYWEREKFVKGTCDYIESCLHDYFPPKDGLIKHVVINEIARKALKERKGLDSTNVPNVFNYSASLWTVDDYNSDLRKKIGLKDDDILVLQATRIVERKAIELAIDVVAELNSEKNLETLYANKLYDGRQFTKDNRIVLVLAGLHEFSSKYIEYLKGRAGEKNVDLLFINEIIEDVRCTKDGKKCYSLWDAFANSDLVTYPSVYEGWGNQFLETVFAKKPVVVYEYPVYLTDIKASGFDIISLGSTHTVGKSKLVNVDEEILESAGLKSIEILTDNNKRNQVVEKNFEICRKNFSYDSLEKIMRILFTF